MVKIAKVIKGMEKREREEIATEAAYQEITKLAKRLRAEADKLDKLIATLTTSKI